MSARQRWLIATLVVLVLPPLAALVLMASATLTHKQRPVHTGDALCDAYVQALVDRDAAPNLDPRDMYYTQAGLPEAQWLRWERRYGNDPRFWVLCYHQRQWGEEYSSSVAGVQVTGNTRYLEQARERGIADWTVLNKLTGTYTKRWQMEAEGILGLASLKRTATQQERLDYNAKISAEIERRHGGQLRQLLSELRSAGADQAAAHYQLAVIATESGEMAGALAELAAGNAAPNNDADLCAPYDMLVAEARQGRPLAGDSLIAGQLSAEYITVALPNFLRSKNMVRTLSARAVQNGDSAAQETLHKYCCRFGMSKGAGYIQAYQAGEMGKIVLDDAAQALPLPSAKQKQAMGQVQAVRGNLRSALRSNGSKRQALSAVPKGLDALLEKFAAPACGGRYYILEQQRWYGRDLISEQQALAGPVRQQFEALAKLDLQ